MAEAVLCMGFAEEGARDGARTGGMIDLSIIEVAETEPGAGLFKKWYAGLAKALGASLRVVPLQVFLAGACGVPELRPLLAQIVWQLSERVERSLGGQVTADAAHRSIRFEWASLDDTFSGAGVAHRLAEYVFEGVSRSSAFPTFTISTDKAHIKVCRSRTASSCSPTT